MGASPDQGYMGMSEPAEGGRYDGKRGHDGYRCSDLPRMARCHPRSNL